MSATDRIREAISSTANHTSKSMHERTVPVTAWEAQALCDLADDARRRLNTGICDYCYEDDCTGNAVGICPCSHTCHESEHEADEAVEAALARLDGEGADG